ncbi:MAG: LysM peptidoglycan-binding domain-containing protein, partial [Brevinematales bacterium]
VQPGDTLLGIARRTGIPATYIRRLNELSDTLRVGQILILPDEVKEYTVQSGDSLLGLARRFSTTLSALILCNQLPHETIYVGQKLLIPIFAETNVPPSSNAPVLSQEKGIRHTVQPGETLYSIARQYGVSVTNLLLWNKKTNSMVFVGERLSIYPRKETNTLVSSVSSPERIDFPVPLSLILSVESTSRGVRIRVKETTSLRSTVSGIVEYTGWLYGFGNVVILFLGDEKRMVFGELDSITVRKGEKVFRGDRVATIQSGGQFYLEIRDGTTVIDPLKWYKIQLAQVSTKENNL